MEVVADAFKLWSENPQMPILFRGIGKRQQTHCKRGHLRIDANLRAYRGKGGKTQFYCVLCRKIRDKAMTAICASVKK
jgi:hypothetical protein